MPAADEVDRSWTAGKVLANCQQPTRGDQRYAFAGSPSGYGLLTYADWGRLLPDLTARFNDHLGDKTSAQTYADEATRLIDLALGARK